MNLKKIKRIMCKQKQIELLKYKATEEYLTEVINGGKEDRRPDLIQVQLIISELEDQINFFKK